MQKYMSIFVSLLLFHSINAIEHSLNEVYFDEDFTEKFSIKDYNNYNQKLSSSYEYTIDTVNQTELVSELVTAIYNRNNYYTIQNILDLGVDTCESDVRKARKSWMQYFNYNDYENRLRCYPNTLPIPYNLRVACPSILIEAVQNRDFSIVDEILTEYPDLATCGEGIETLLHQPSNPIYSWFSWRLNPIDLEMAELLYNYGSRVHAPDRYGNPTWIDRSCTNKYDSYCNLDGEKPLGNILAINGLWNFDWFR
jgi:hypothetical protein